jgi:ATP-dependent Clp protease ATP-binding subunit ClpC
MFERFTQGSRDAVEAAAQMARDTRAERIETIHLLLAVAANEGSAGGHVLREMGLDARAAEEVRQSVQVKRLPVEIGVSAPPRDEKRNVAFTVEAKKALEFALREALTLGHNYIGTEHIVLGALRVDDGQVAAALGALLRHNIIRFLSGPGGRRR